MTDVPLSTLLLLSAAGFGAGFVDSIAGGGGLVTMPALLAVGLPPHLALGTNKGQSVFGAIASAHAFLRRGLVDRDRALPGFLLGLVGAALGALAVLAVRPEPLRPIVMALLLAAAVVVITRRNLDAQPRALRHPALALAAVALGLGFYDGFFGPGVGSLLIIAFVLVFGDAMTRASANAKIVNLASNLAAVLLFAYRGKVVWAYALAMAAANVVGATTGARLAIQRGDRFVRFVVACVVTAVLVKLGVDLIRSRGR